MSTNNIFAINTSDLGADLILTGTSKEDIDHTLKQDYEIDDNIQCYICNNTPIYKLIAKDPLLATEQLEKIGYVCQQCLNHYIDPSKYGIRKICKNNEEIGGLL